MFGDVLCRITGFLLDICYTVSILSLCAVSMERYLLICNVNPSKKTKTWCVKVDVFIWIVSALLCCPTLYGYTAQQQQQQQQQTYNHHGLLTTNSSITINGNSSLSCSARYWSNTSYIIYCCIHGGVVYVVPMGVMLVTHHLIARALKQQRMATGH